MIAVAVHLGNAPPRLGCGEALSSVLLEATLAGGHLPVSHITEIRATATSFGR